MARQHVHNRRAGRGGGGASWISYSDIMAALVLVFVLFLTFNLYQYNKMMEEKTAQLNAQQLALEEKEGLIIIQQGKLDEQSAELDQIKIDLDAKQNELDAQKIILIGQQEELENAQATLAVKETELAAAQLALNNATTLLGQQQAALEAQQAAFNAQTLRIDALVGIRTQIVEELSTTLATHNMNATVDPKTGDIMLESTVFFKTNSYEIKDEGRAMLDEFLPLYLSVLLQPQYADYLGEIIIEGHTDSTGGYINNLKLSQNRALSVAEYCLNLPFLTQDQSTLLQSILTAKGRSSSDLVYNADGTENKDASRRVEFKFSLRDAEMIDQMRDILREQNSRSQIVDEGAAPEMETLGELTYPRIVNVEVN